MNINEFFIIFETKFSYEKLQNINIEEIAKCFGNTCQWRENSFSVNVDNDTIDVLYVKSGSMFLINNINGNIFSSKIHIIYQKDGKIVKQYNENNVNCVEIIDICNDTKEIIKADFNFNTDFAFFKNVTFSMKCDEFFNLNVAHFFKDFLSNDVNVDDFIQKIITNSFLFATKNILKYKFFGPEEMNLIIKEKIKEYFKDNINGKTPEDCNEEEKFYYLLKNS